MSQLKANLLSIFHAAYPVQAYAWGTGGNTLDRMPAHRRAHTQKLWQFRDLRFLAAAGNTGIRCKLYTHRLLGKTQAPNCSSLEQQCCPLCHYGTHRHKSRGCLRAGWTAGAPTGRNKCRCCKICNVIGQLS